MKLQKGEQEMLGRLLITAYIALLFLLSHSASIAGTVGDINGDGHIDLTEAVYALQISTGVYPNLSPSCVLSGLGNWSAGVEYHECDVVTYSGSTYACTNPHTSDVFASETSNWALLTTTGPQGEKGDTGDCSSCPSSDPCNVYDQFCEECDERPYELLDSSDNVIAYCKKRCDNIYDDCKSSTGYDLEFVTGTLDPAGTYNFDTTLYIGDQDKEYSLDRGSGKTDFFYDNSSCSGNTYESYYVPSDSTGYTDCRNDSATVEYERINYKDNYISEETAKGIGSIIDRVGGDGGEFYYIKPYTKYFILSNVYQWANRRISTDPLIYECYCEELGPKSVYQVFPNDPAVTGFQNTYYIAPARDWYRNYYNWHY